MIAVWRGKIAAGSRTPAMVSWIDILPTLVDVAGGRPPTDIDGRSFAGVMRGQTKVHRDRIFTTHSGDGRMNVYPTRSVRTADWKYIRNLNPEFYYTTHVDLVQASQFRDALVSTAFDLWPAGRDDASGHGLVQAAKALAKLQGTGGGGGGTGGGTGGGGSDSGDDTGGSDSCVCASR